MATPQFGVGKVIISGSGAVTTTGATPNTYTSSVFGNVPASSALTLWLNWTANSGTGGANTGFVQLDTSADGGTTWLTAFRFAQITGSSGQIMVNLRTDGLGGNEAAASSGIVGTVTGGIIQNVVLMRDQRWVWTLANAGQSLTFGVFAGVMPAGSRGGYQC